MKTNRLILLLFILFPAYVLAGNRFQELYTNIHQFISQQKAEVGVAIIADGKDTVTIENNRRYPLMSVFKLHQALAVGDYCKRHQLSFDTLLTVDSTDLQPNTYSPLRDRYPHGGKFSLKQLMEYTLHLSDNNACDILFKFTGGPAVTDRYIRSLGINDFSIQYTEDDMHQDLNLGYEKLEHSAGYRRSHRGSTYPDFIRQTSSGIHQRSPCHLSDWNKQNSPPSTRQAGHRRA